MDLQEIGSMKLSMVSPMSSAKRLVRFTILASRDIHLRHSSHSFIMIGDGLSAQKLSMYNLVHALISCNTSGEIRFNERDHHSI